MKITKKNAVVGNTAYFRCGGKGEITYVGPSRHRKSLFFISFKGTTCGSHYTKNGHVILTHPKIKECISPFSIIKITKGRKKHGL